MITNAKVGYKEFKDREEARKFMDEAQRDWAERGLSGTSVINVVEHHPDQQGMFSNSVVVWYREVIR